MRLRNNKNAKPVLEKADRYVINDLSLLHNLNCLFNNQNKVLEIEIGMGKGDFIIQKATINPNINYIGIEKFPTVMLIAYKKLLKQNLNNILLLSLDAEQLPLYFSPSSIDKIYLNFSDPWPKKRHTKKRLTNPRFLEVYHSLLKENGLIEFKTDNDSLFEYTINDVLTEDKETYHIHYLTYDLYKDINNPNLINNVQTEYEKKFVAQNVAIKKVVFSFTKSF
ncbi:tRNA (guanosine(46)-N7)-methyltransferase TrmB [Ureaplasma canigenitalium]|uniref:tRNA (guanosine(46)-N7)-methyltransferase TrmB n=1 Tax=Ureaplasma canigenitalium TaxID=42092 RepID=UPI0004E195EF|nr:tRNA (guanosine(46)-N7)-methyltransferase TrmB [Ureaplasma canigenitalium]